MERLVNARVSAKKEDFPKFKAIMEFGWSWDVNSQDEVTATLADITQIKAEIFAFYSKVKKAAKDRGYTVAE